MKQFYMDTDVFISRLKPDDPYHSAAGVIAESLEEDEIQAETTVLTILELASIPGRLYEAKEGVEKGERERKVFIVRTLRRLAELEPKFINISGDTQISVKGIGANLPSVFKEAILKSEEYA